MAKTVMITGAGSGFGRGAALALAERGHTVYATTETDAQAAELAAAAPQLIVERVDITTDDVAKAASWPIDVLINNAGAAFGPYSMTKFALESFGKTLRGELAGQGIDVTLINPGPYLTGFNDRMADSMWEWFSEDSLSAPSTPLFQMMRQFVTEGQMDPQEVVDKLVELVEAETTTENNFVPENILGGLPDAPII